MVAKEAEIITKIQDKGGILVKKGTKGRINLRTKKDDKYIGYVYQTKKTLNWRPKKDADWYPTRHYESVYKLLEDVEKFLGMKTTPKKPKESKDTKETTPKKTIKKVRTDFIDSNKETQKVIFAIENKKNILLKGDSGCGKSFLIEQLAKKYKKKIYTVNCDIELDKSELIGKYEVVDGKTQWIVGILIRAMKEGAWIVFDEANTAKPEIMSSLHSVLDHRRSIEIKEHHSEKIKAHEDFRAFGTYNPNYAGTAEFNFAFRSRFTQIVEVNYLPPNKEKTLLMKRTGIDENKASMLVRIGLDSRRMAKEGKLSNPISTRHLLEMAEMLVKSDFTPIECAGMTLNISDDFGEMEDVLNVVKNYF